MVQEEFDFAGDSDASTATGFDVGMAWLDRRVDDQQIAVVECRGRVFAEPHVLQSNIAQLIQRIMQFRCISQIGDGHDGTTFGQKLSCGDTAAKRTKSQNGGSQSRIRTWYARFRHVDGLRFQAGVISCRGEACGGFGSKRSRTRRYWIAAVV